MIDNWVKLKRSLKESIPFVAGDTEKSLKKLKTLLSQPNWRWSEVSLGWEGVVGYSYREDWCDTVCSPQNNLSLLNTCVTADVNYSKFLATVT